ncbi:MAG: prepilin-type N-terminal cleavage/methylation domain-containing protein [Nitrospirota bacterium]|nr:prepilin-type N-terminal cleavage/methylation domain-containing protein [Nitrospirota bacterium]
MNAYITSRIRRIFQHVRSQRGFTLIELLVTSVILAIGMLGSAGMVMNSISGNDRAKDLTIAVQLANDQIQMVRENVKTFDGFIALALSFSTPNKKDPVDPVPGFSRYTTVQLNVPERWMLTVTVRIERNPAVGETIAAGRTKTHSQTAIIIIPPDVQLG